MVGEDDHLETVGHLVQYLQRGTGPETRGTAACLHNGGVFFMVEFQAAEAIEGCSRNSRPARSSTGSCCAFRYSSAQLSRILRATSRRRYSSVSSTSAADLIAIYGPDNLEVTEVRTALARLRASE